MKEKVTAGKIWGIIYPVLIALAVSEICAAVWSVIMTIQLMGTGNYSSNEALMQRLQELSIEYALMLTMIASLITIPILIFFMHRDRKKDCERGLYIKYSRVSFLKYILIIPFAIFGMLAANYFTSILIMFMPDSMLSTYDYAQQAIYGSSMALQVIAAAIVGPIVEELIFRGLIYTRIKKMAGVMCAAILSSAIFGVYHGNWVQLPYAFIIGLICVYVYEKYKTIAAPIILHMSANMFSVILSCVASGTSGEQTAAFSFEEQLMSLMVMTIITGCFALLFGAAINKIVKSKEVSV